MFALNNATNTTAQATSIDWSTLKTADGQHELTSVLVFFLGIDATCVCGVIGAYWR